MRVLGIESSCDETAAALVDDTGLLASTISSQVDIHARFGGVVPEIASRNHLMALPHIIDHVLDKAGMTLAQVEGIAVTARPGLVGALLVGVSAAKSLSFALGIPLVGVHHLEAHLYAAWLSGGELTYPHLGLVVSGGHTSLLMVRGLGNLELLGATRDDAAGEAFDKIAKLLGLGYPGGPIMDAYAAQGDPLRYVFPQSLRRRDTLDFSFSGLKTAVRRQVALTPPVSQQDRYDLCASVQHAIVEIICAKVLQALSMHPVSTVVAAGGVVANRGLRAGLEAATAQAGVRLVIPPFHLCTDNAAMVAALGRKYLMAGVRSTLALNAEPYRPLGVAGFAAAGD